MTLNVSINGILPNELMKTQIDILMRLKQKWSHIKEKKRLSRYKTQLCKMCKNIFFRPKFDPRSTSKQRCVPAGILLTGYSADPRQLYCGKSL